MTNIADSLRSFLVSPGLKVAALKGDWGTGKTFFWNKFLEQNRGGLKFRAYSYVSLFGAADIEEVRRHIFTNFEVLDGEGMQKHMGKLKPLSALLKSVDIPYLNSTSSISSYVERKLIDNFLICFDDLERKEPGISAATILGLISQLKEEHNCKIILIYNESELDKDSQKEISEYREKVIDLELKYQPTTKQNLSIVWPQGAPFEVEAAFTSIGLNNIRVMQRVKWAFDYLEPTIVRDYPPLWKTFKAKIASLVIIHHAFAEKLSLDEAVSTSYYARILSKEETDKTRFEVLKDLGYVPDKFDSVIAEYIKNGYVNWEYNNDLLASSAAKSKFDSINAEHRAIWQTFHHGFVKSQAEFVKNHVDFLHKHADGLRLGDVWASVSFLQELDPKCKVDGLLDKAIAKFVQNADRSDETFLRRMGMPLELVKKIESQLAARKSPHTIEELFLLMAGESGWNSADLIYFQHYTEDQIYNWITSETTIDMIGVLREFLRRFSSDKQAAEAVAKVKAAIERVKARSPFDARRVALIEKD